MKKIIKKTYDKVYDAIYSSRLPNTSKIDEACGNVFLIRDEISLINFDFEP